MSNQVLRLAGQDSCVECKDLFTKLAGEAESGALVGAIVIAMYARNRSNRPYNVALSGWASKNPTYAAGALSASHVLVQELALEEAGLL